MKSEAGIEIEMSDLTEDAVRRLLKDAWRQQALNSMPSQKRKKAKKEMEDEDEEDEEMEELAQKDNAAKVAMNRGDSGPTLPSMTADDLPRGVKMPKPSKAKKEKKNG
jgi:hypothetical protein